MIKLMVMLIMSNVLANVSNLDEDTVICSFPKSMLLNFMKEGEYKPESLRVEGFIHCCKPSQLSYVADKFFKDDEQVLLVSDKKTLGKGLIYEGEREFPHLFRALKINDILDIVFLKRDLQSNKFDLSEVFDERN